MVCESMKRLSSFAQLLGEIKGYCMVGTDFIYLYRLMLCIFSPFNWHYFLAFMKKKTEIPRAKFFRTIFLMLNCALTFENNLIRNYPSVLFKITLSYGKNPIHYFVGIDIHFMIMKWKKCYRQILDQLLSKCNFYYYYVSWLLHFIERREMVYFEEYLFPFQMAHLYSSNLKWSSKLSRALESECNVIWS